MHLDEAFSADHPFVVKQVAIRRTQMARTAALTKQDLEDFRQDLYLEYIRRRNDFDPSRASPEAFAVVVIKHAAIDWCMKRQAAKRGRSLPHESLDKEIDLADGTITESDTLTSNCDFRCPQPKYTCDTLSLRVDLATAVRQLPPELRLIFQNIVEGLSEAEIIRKSGWSRDAVRWQFQKLRKFLESKGLKKYLFTTPQSASFSGS